MIQQKQLCFCFLNFKTAAKSFEVFLVLMAYLHTVNWTEGNIIPNIAKGNWFHAKLIIWDIQWVKGDRNQGEIYIYIYFVFFLKLPKKSIRSLIKFCCKSGRGIIKSKLKQCLQVEITLGKYPLNSWKRQCVEFYRGIVGTWLQENNAWSWQSAAYYFSSKNACAIFELIKIKDFTKNAVCHIPPLVSLAMHLNKCEAK